VQSKRCQKAGQTYSEAVVVAETVGRGIVQTQMGCGQGRRRKRREVGRLAQIRRRRRELLRGGAQTEWNSVWHSTGHLQTWRQRMGRHYSLYYGLRLPKKGGGMRISQSLFLISHSVISHDAADVRNGRSRQGLGRYKSYSNFCEDNARGMAGVGGTSKAWMGHPKGGQQVEVVQGPGG